MGACGRRPAVGDAAGASFDFDRQNARGVEAARGATPAQTLERLRAVADRTSGPPTYLAALESRLVEEIAHGEDSRRAVGITRDYPSEALVAALATRRGRPRRWAAARAWRAA